MPFEYSYDPQAGLIRIVGRGAVSMDDRIRCVRRLLDDADLPARAEILIEVNAVEAAPVADDIRVIALLIERLQSKFSGRVAIANLTVGHVTLSHLVALSVSGGHDRVRVFASEEEACDWLMS